jgi:hypothetical protein
MKTQPIKKSAISAAAAALGSIRTEQKTMQSRINIRKATAKYAQARIDATAAKYANDPEALKKAVAARVYTRKRRKLLHKLSTEK